MAKGDIEVIEVWASPLVQEYVEALKEDVRRVMALPAWAMRSPSAYDKALRNAMQASEVMRQHIVRLSLLYMRPTLIIEKGESNANVSLPPPA